MKQTVQVEVDTTKVEQEAYKKGLDDAWAAAKKLYMVYTQGEIEDIFGIKRISGFSLEGSVLAEVFENYHAFKALAKIREYEEKKKAEDEAVKVGDEVETDGGTRFAVTFVYDDGKRCAGYGSDGKHCGIETAYCRKTGRHFPEIAAVLEQMKGE